MENQESLTSEQRFEIIEEMISTAQGKITNNSFQFLLWGWVIALANLGHYMFIQYNILDKPEIIWMITFPTAIISAIYGYKKGKKSTFTTYTDKLSMWIWIAFFLCLMILIVFNSQINYMINPLILLFTGYATFLSGITIKFKPLIIGGVIFWVSSILGFMVSYEHQLLIGASAIVLGYLVPGYMLKSRK